jgi:RNA polymerase sigma-70 factor (ECF subfamily)
LRPEPIIDNPAAGIDPEHEALLADAVGIALQVVLDTLSPAERLAFVLHDMFAVPCDEIAGMVDRSPQATRQLASRGRRRVRDSAPPPDPDLTCQRAVVDAYFAAARDGDLDALVAVLDPDVLLRAHRRDGDPLELHGAARVAEGAISARRFAPYVRPALINGAAGVIAFDGGQPFAVLAFTVLGDHAIAIDVFNDPELVAKLDIHGITA